MNPRIAVYPGSFDPVTNGHVNLIRRSALLFDRVIVAVAFNPRKAGLFTPPERIALLKSAVASLTNVEVDAFDGLLVDYVRRKGARVVLRGLRALSDFEYEFQMAHMNHKLGPEIETLFLMTGPEEFFISSQVVREVASLHGPVDDLVPPQVREALEQRFRKE